MSYNITPNDLQALRVFNTRLATLQTNLLTEAIKLDSELSQRVLNEDDILHDYEIELNLSFYLKEDDKAYKEDEDNIFTNIDEYLKGVSKDKKQYPWRWDHNHNEFCGRGKHPMSQDHHCWWFHCLYDHNHIEFKELLRIGGIWSDIKVTYQYFEQQHIKKRHKGV